MPEAADTPAVPAPPSRGGPGEAHPATAVPGRRLRRRRTALRTVLPLLAAALTALPATSASARPAATTGGTTSASASGVSHAVSAAATGAARSAAPSAPSAAPTGSRSADLSLSDLAPTAPEPGDTLTISGTVTNKSAATISGGRIGLRVGPPLTTRSAVEHVAKRRDFVPGVDGTEISRKHSVRVAGMRPGISRTFRLEVPVSALKLDRNGVYQLSVSLTGKTRARPYDQVLGIERSFLPWQRGAVKKRAKLTYLWPLISDSHLTARTESDEQQTPVFLDDSLARQIAPGGRLQQLVTLGRELPVTWVVDPDLLAAVDMMTKPYRVRKKGGGTTEGTAQQHAKEWLRDLQRAVAPEPGEGSTAKGAAPEVVALPFADPDLASLAHRGKGVRDALSSLGPATELAARTVETVLETEASTDFAWPVDGAVDSSIVDVATSAGAHHVIARSDSVQDRGLPYTPSAPRPIGGGNTAVVADANLSKAFEGDMSRAGRSTSAIQRFLAQAQVIAAQDPSQRRNLLVAPQRMPTVSQAQAMAVAIRTLDESGRWTSHASLAQTARAKPDPRANRRVPSARAYPAALRARELPTRAFEEVRRTRATLDDFKVILSRDDRVVTPFGTAIHRTMSTSWRDSPAAAAEYRESVRDYLLGLVRKVRLIKKSDITLSGRSATIPVTVQNNLVQRVDGLELRLSSSRRIGLEVGEPQPVVVDGGHSQSVKFETTAKANGRATVVAQLYTKDGEPYGQPMEFKVKVTSITSTVLLVISGGVLLVVLAGIRMYTQRKRRGAAPDPDAPLNADSPENADTSDSPEDASDSAETDDASAPGKGGGAEPGDGERAAADTGEPATPSGPSTSSERPAPPAASGSASGDRAAGPDSGASGPPPARQSGTNPENPRNPDQNASEVAHPTDEATNPSGTTDTSGGGDDTGGESDTPSGPGEKVDR
ncbi:DUF6049 family protein [Streptomyces sp. AJS327]|uniref:DUF6049 family protein n=1 Tax=Streptomyces sp. AJS327 TaxID=2545265 RepID=UPI0015DDF1CC|nr:DUF6049 family protein [Streptomyces sp. AJS327]